MSVDEPATLPQRINYAEAFSEAGKVLGVLLLFFGVSWLIRGMFGEFAYSLVATMCYLIGAAIVWPVTWALTLFDISDRQLIIFSIIGIIPYWVILGLLATLFHSGQTNPSIRKLRTRLTIVLLTILGIAILIFVVVPSMSHRELRAIKMDIFNNLRQIDSAKKNLALNKDISPEYVPVESDLTNLINPVRFRQPERTVQYFFNSMNAKPYALLTNDWRVPRRGLIEGYTLTNGTIFQLH